MPTQIELVKELSVDSDNWYEKYPWFSVGQLINVSNKKQQDTFKPAAQLTAIYFNDVHRLHWLIHEQVLNKNKILNDLTVPISIESMQNTPQPFPKREHAQEVIAPTHLIAIAAVEEQDAIYNQISTKAEKVIIGDVIIHNHITDLDDKILPETSKIEKIVVADTENLPEQSNFYIQQPEEIKEEKPIIEDAISSIETTKPIQETLSAATFTAEIKSVFSNENKSIAAADGLESINKAQKNIKSILDSSDAMSISFEPYHTIDYFASQGIKVDLKADDKLGKQLKSFTSWLKSMKRLPISEETTTDSPTEQLQDKSLENTNVVTEAMAAVLLKQGKKEQAVDIFKKLSLLHPEKSRYFAAQIEQIKN